MTTSGAHLKKIIIAFGVGCCLFVLYFIATHGFIRVENVSNDKLIVIPISQMSLGEKQTINNGTILKSGVYAVRNDSSGEFRLATVTVPGWLQSARITYAKTSYAQLQKSAALTYENFLQTDSGRLLSFTNLDSAVSGYTEHSTEDAFGGKANDYRLSTRLTSPITMHDGSIVGFGEKNTLTRYSFNTDSTTPLGITGHTSGIGTSIDNVFRSTSSADTYGVYIPNDKNIFILSGNTVRMNTTLPKDKTYTGHFDVNTTHWANVTSVRKTTTGDDSEQQDFSINVGSIDNKETQTLDIGLGRAVSAVSISPESKYVAIIKNNELWIYSLRSKQPVYVDMFTMPHTIFWHNNILYSVSVEAGVIRIDPQTMSSYSIIHKDMKTLKFTNVIPMGSKMYATAFTKNAISRLPDGYILDVTKQDDKVTQKLSSLLPVKNTTYEANFLANTVYVRPTYYPPRETTEEYQIRKEVIKKKASIDLAKKLGESSSNTYRIVIID